MFVIIIYADTRIWYSGLFKNNKTAWTPSLSWYSLIKLFINLYLTSQCIAQCIMECNDCGASTWNVITNSLDIDFIHGAIHGWSYKKVGIFTGMNSKCTPRDTYWWYCQIDIVMQIICANTQAYILCQCTMYNKITLNLYYKWQLSRQ